MDLDALNSGAARDHELDSIKLAASEGAIRVRKYATQY
jgi:hypothetical protein